jgi:hypothetical protein
MIYAPFAMNCLFRALIQMMAKIDRRRFRATIHVQCARVQHINHAWTRG